MTKTNNSSNIRKNSKSFLDVSNGTRRKFSMKKNRVKKSRDTVTQMEMLIHEEVLLKERVMLMLEEFLLKLVVHLTHKEVSGSYSIIQRSCSCLRRPCWSSWLVWCKRGSERDGGTRFLLPIFSWIFSILV
jgi:hypothetical protein